MTMINADDLLENDSDFTNAILKHLPKFDQRKWAEFDHKPYRGYWKAFMAFLTMSEKVARNMRLTALSQSTMENPGKCFPKLRVAAISTSTDTKCPECEIHHFRKDNTTTTDWFSCCQRFRDKTPNERIMMADKHSSCLLCTSWSHSTQNCTWKDLKCNHIEDGEICGENHSRWFHVLKK